LLRAGARKTDKPALITSKIRERFFGKNKGKKQAPSAVRQAAICALQNNISLNKIVEQALQRFLMLEN
jgi:predicted HicB family RNase H-like nuclease